jgi:hypothetical protein
MELAQVLLETPQLGVAERSPIASIEHQHYRAMAFEQFRRSHLFAGDVLKNKRRRCLAWAQRSLRRWDLLRQKDSSNHKEPEQKDTEHGEN